MKKYLLTMLAVLVGSNMWAQSFSYTESNKTLTIVVTTDLSNDNDAAGKVQTEMAKDKPETIVVNGGGKINSNFVKALLYDIYSSTNANVKTLDLGGVVLTDWDCNTFRKNSDNRHAWDLKIETLALPKTPDNIIPDEPFLKKDEYHSWNELKKLVIPEGCVRIGSYLTQLMKNLETVKWPDTVEEIGDMAFANLTKWNIPALPKNLEIIGNSAFALTSQVTCKTIMFPSSVKIICPGAFLMRQYQEVYFQSKTAPLLPLGESLIQPSYGNMTAFGAETLMGNNGCNGPTSKYADNFSEGKANRENYVASSGVYFAILHFPKGLTDDEKATYTDINKKYETWNGTDGKFYQADTKVVGQETSTLKYGDYKVNNQVNPGYKDTYVGEDYIWPSQSQWMRSFLTATNGVCWDGVTPYTSDLSAEQIALLRKVGYSETKYTDEALKNIAYVGTRQFVLTADDATTTTPEFPLPLKKGGRWWTLCVPFNMTKKMVDDAMGEGTQVCRFSSVTRKLDTDGKGRGDGNKGNHIYLEFRHDVYKHKFERAADGTFHDNEWSEDLPACGDNDIVIYAHEAYMVKPTKTDEDAAFVVKDYEPVPGSPLPTIIKAKETRYKNNSQSEAVNDNVGEYRFIGNYINTAQREAISVPVNCYFYGLAKKSDTKPAFWFWPYNSHLTWPSYKCTVETVNVELGEQDACDFFNFVAGFSASSKYQSSFFGDDELNSNEPTSVDQVVIVAGNDDQAIYNLSGQLVSKNGNLDGLQKGVYVKGGKKFIVK